MTVTVTTDRVVRRSAAAGVQISLDELGTPLRDVTFVVVDLETTGGSPAAALGRRQNAEKSCSPRNGSQARSSSARSRAPGTCQARCALKGSGTGPVWTRYR